LSIKDLSIATDAGPRGAWFTCRSSLISEALRVESKIEEQHENTFNCRSDLHPCDHNVGIGFTASGLEIRNQQLRFCHRADSAPPTRFSATFSQVTPPPSRPSQKVRAGSALRFGPARLASASSSAIKLADTRLRHGRAGVVLPIGILQ
jgi:hypothetical protein